MTVGDQLLKIIEMEKEKSYKVEMKQDENENNTVSENEKGKINLSQNVYNENCDFSLVNSNGLDLATTAGELQLNVAEQVSDGNIKPLHLKFCLNIPKDDTLNDSEIKSTVNNIGLLYPNHCNDVCNKQNENMFIISTQERNITDQDAITTSKPALKGGLLLPKEKLSLPEACKSGKVELVLQALQCFKDDINKFTGGWTCLHDVCMRECQFSAITEVLIQHGADVNIQDDSGNTPLHIAVSYHCVENVKILLKYNADITKLNKEGASPIHAAFFVKDDEILQLLGHDPIAELTQKTKNKHSRKRKFNHGKNKLLECVSPPILKKPKTGCISGNSKTGRVVKFTTEYSVKLFDRNAKIG